MSSGDNGHILVYMGQWCIHFFSSEGAVSSKGLSHGYPLEHPYNKVLLSHGYPLEHPYNKVLQPPVHWPRAHKFTHKAGCFSAVLQCLSPIVHCHCIDPENKSKTIGVLIKGNLEILHWHFQPDKLSLWSLLFEWPFRHFGIRLCAVLNVLNPIHRLLKQNCTMIVVICTRTHKNSPA